MTTNSDISKPIAIWRFIIPLVLQTALIIAVPAQAIYTYMTGKTVILQTVPFDPYDLLRGYSQTLRYDISEVENLEKLPGWNELKQQNKASNDTYLPPGTNFYVILESPKITKAETKIPPAWKPIAVSPKLPSNLPPNRIALQGESDYGWINYGLETYYMPEEQREQLNQEIWQIQRQPGEQRPFVVEVKIDHRGKAVAESLWIGDRNYRF